MRGIEGDAVVRYFNVFGLRGEFESRCTQAAISAFTGEKHEKIIHPFFNG